MKIILSQNFYHCFKIKYSWSYCKSSYIPFLVLLITSCSEMRQNTLESANLKGAIKSITLSTHDAFEVFGEPKYESSIKAFTFVWESRYDRDGYLRESNAYDPTGFYGQDTVLSKTKYQYDKNGNRIESRTYDRTGKLTATWEYYYNDKGIMTGSSNCQSAQKTDVNSGTRINVTCNDKGQIIKQEMRKCDDELIMIVENKYNEIGIVAEEKTTMLGGQSSIKYFKYDDKKNLIEEVSDSGRLTYKYEFDSTGNWVKKYEYKNDELEKVFVREIEYYN